MEQAQTAAVMPSDKWKAAQQGMSLAEILQHKGARLLKFVQDVNSGAATWKKIILGELSSSAAARLQFFLGVEIPNVLQVFIKDTIWHTHNRNHVLTDHDWMDYPKLLDFFDEAAYGRAAKNPDLTRVILRKKTMDNCWQGGVVDLALNGKQPKMLSVTYFKGNDQEINDWWQRNKKP